MGIDVENGMFYRTREADGRMKVFDLVAFGEVALDVMLLGVDRFPRRWSELARMKRGGIYPVGSAGYVAQCFSKLGGRAAVVGRIGDDTVGRLRAFGSAAFPHRT